MKVRYKTKSGRVLDKIRQSPDGMTFTEIQRFVLKMNGKNPDEMVPQTDWGKVEKIKHADDLPTVMKRRWRGSWCANLCYADGILREFCAKVDGKWRILALYSRGTYVSLNGARVLKVWRSYDPVARKSRSDKRRLAKQRRTERDVIEAAQVRTSFAREHPEFAAIMRTK